MDDNLEKLEDLRERAEALAEVSERLVREPLSRNDLLILVGGGIVGGVLIGLAIGYKMAQKKLEPKYAELAKKEIAEARPYYEKLYKEGNFATPEAAAEQLRPEVQQAADALLRYQGDNEGDDTPEEPSVTVTTTNVFQQKVEVDFDLEEEKKGRSSEVPYIISHDEFMEAEPGFEQVSLTYFSGDATLADDKDEPIPVPEDVVGDALEHFGYGSGDMRTVFVRNEKLTLDFEISLSDGKFAHEVLGLQHSADTFERMGQPRKFRGGNE